jgi:hypothetical protein
MDPATIIAGISAISGLASAMKPAPVQSNSADVSNASTATGTASTADANPSTPTL